MLYSRTFTGAWIETIILCSFLFVFGRTFTGAWIETVSFFCSGVSDSSTFTGAWIETPKQKQRLRLNFVAPSRVREIETWLNSKAGKSFVMVAPSRVRGLKLFIRTWSN